MIPTLNIRQGTFLKFSSRLPAVSARSAASHAQVTSWPHLAREDRGHASLGGVRGVHCWGRFRPVTLLGGNCGSPLYLVLQFCGVTEDRRHACAGSPLHGLCVRDMWPVPFSVMLRRHFYWSWLIWERSSSCSHDCITPPFYIMSNSKYSRSILIPVTLVFIKWLRVAGSEPGSPPSWGWEERGVGPGSSKQVRFDYFWVSRIQTQKGELRLLVLFRKLLAHVVCILENQMIFFKLTEIYVLLSKDPRNQ